MASDPENEGPLPPSLRFLKVLVTVLTATMILGLITIIAIFVIRLRPVIPTMPPLPDQIVLPDGASAVSVAWGAQIYVVVTDDNRVMVFASSGKLLKTVEIE